MSSRTLSRMKPEEINAIIDGRSSKIRAAAEANAALEERRAYAERASKLLEYKPLKAAVEYETVETPADVVLLRALANLGIRPLDLASVVRYKNHMASNVVNKLMKAIGLPLICSSLLCMAIALVSAHFVSVSAAENRVDSVWGLLFGIGFFLVWVEHAFVPRREWSVTELKNSGVWHGAALLPRGVLDLGMQVKEVLPNAGLYVHQLNKDSGPWFKVLDVAFGGVGNALRSLDDPFLEVRFGGESYFIAVWDEPGFDGKLMEVD